jgi:DNA topoisomerase-2
MPIWSLTNERLEKLKNQITAKKAEYDELNALSEKDLWVKDLDGFIEEWHTQLKLDEEIATDIRRLGRRASHKIGAGRGRRVKDDDDYQPEKKTKPKAPKVETKTHQRFTEKFQAAAKPKPQNDLSDDDFALLGKKAAVKQESEPPASLPDAPNGRNKRAAATKSKYVLSDDSDEDFMDLGKPEVKDEAGGSESEEVVEKPTRRVAAKAKPSYMDEEFGTDSDGDEDDKMLGDVGALVKGIGAPTASSSNGGRLSLFAMSRPEAGDAPIPKLKSKPSKSAMDIDSHDDTNYEALAMSSPRKSTKADDLDDFLSDDDLPAASKPAAAKPAASTAASKAKAPLSVVPAPAKKRGRPAGSKNKPKDDDAPAPKAKAKPAAAAAAAKPKPSVLSPAAKAYAAKKAKAKRVLSDDEDDIVDEPASPVAAPPKARPGRAAATKAKPIYIDDDEDDSFVSGGTGGGGGGRKGRRDDSDAFDMDDDSE